VRSYPDSSEPATEGLNNGIKWVIIRGPNPEHRNSTLCIVPFCYNLRAYSHVVCDQASLPIFSCQMQSKQRYLMVGKE
jgi:hypothetical protein